MISLFTHYQAGQQALVHATNWPYVRAGIHRNLQRVLTYNRIYPTAVESAHFLIRLLESIGISMNLPTNTYYDAVDHEALGIAMTLGMTSQKSKGKIFEGIFYGHGSHEILLAVDDYFSATDVTDYWQNAEAIKPILHPKSDMAMLIPNGKVYSEEKGLSVIAINITMLAVQYRAFCMGQVSGDPARNLPQFIAAYVLPNMLKAHLEIALFNRIYRAAYGYSDSANLVNRHHPFIQAHYENQLDQAIRRTLDNVEAGVKYFPTILKTLPSFFNKDMYASLILPDVHATMQVDWCLVVARMKVVDFLLKASGYQADIKNQEEINYLLRAYRINNVSSMMEQQLPKSILLEQMKYQEDLLKACAIPHI